MLNPKINPKFIFAVALFVFLPIVYYFIGSKQNLNLFFQNPAVEPSLKYGLNINFTIFLVTVFFLLLFIATLITDRYYKILKLKRSEIYILLFLMVTLYIHSIVDGLFILYYSENVAHLGNSGFLLSKNDYRNKISNSHYIKMIIMGLLMFYFVMKAIKNLKKELEIQSHS